MMWYQKFLREYTEIPVFMSALTQIPSVLSFFGWNETIIIMTANSHSLNSMRDFIMKEAGIYANRDRFVIVGCEGTEIFGPAVSNGLKVHVDECTPEVVAVALKAVRETKNTRAILLECTELPPYSNAIRDATGLPVYDAITNANFGMAGVSETQRFGIDYIKEFDDKQEYYEFGHNLTNAEKK